MANRLAHETSPYLLQHRDNPVDWYPWGDDAFARARREDKPILLSVGYAACHWCHVMEHESFEDRATAAVMNESFVSVKVDREERPDVDSLYMDAVQAMTGQGGWPMTVFLTPDGVPFYGGTYFPAEDRSGLPSFRRLLGAVSETWRTRRTEIEAQAQKLVRHIEDMTRFEPSAEAIDERLLAQALGTLQANFDPAYGGFGSAPKFPQPMTLDLLMRLGERGLSGARDMATHTLDAMAAGGILDQLGGGFHRYSVDRMWIVPHFEKMLYDNAQLVRTYARSWLRTGAARHREVAEATASWMLAEMRDAGGGFWSSLDADSEGVEGRFYVWSLDEVRDVTGPDASIAEEVYGFTAGGNFEGLNIPIFVGPPDDAEALARARDALLLRRATRTRPATDTKVLTGWNALAASSLSEAGALLGRSDWIGAAVETMRFIVATLLRGGRLMRSYRRVDGRNVVRALGCCEDYAFFLEACLALYESTFEREWLERALWAADEAIRLFADEKDGGFFTIGADADDLVLRPKDLFDNAVPSANSVMALELQRLAELSGDDSYTEHAVRAMKLVRGPAAQAPTGFGHALGAMDAYSAARREIVIVGDPLGDAADMISSARSAAPFNRVIVASDRPQSEAELIPLLAGKRRIGERPTAYLCRAGTCRQPVTSVAELAEQIARGA
jgi:uncharacterized protein